MDIVSISPQSKVHLLTNVPLDNKYSDTLTFSNTNNQYSYFLGKVKSGCSYTNCRPSKIKNQLHLPIDAYSVYDCNYLMLQNPNFSNKWLYAFITSIDYVSTESCTINFELDVMQTWYFDYTLKECFVEREHVNDDTLGRHITDEGIDTGEYVRLGQYKSSLLDDLSIVASYAPNNGTTISDTGGLYGKVYSGLKYFDIPIANVGAFNDMLQTTIGNGQGDRIVNIFMCPTVFCTAQNSMPPIYFITPTNRNNVALSRNTTLNGYTPKNNKLFCYPYSFLYVTNNNGGVGVYRYEFMSNPNVPLFSMTGDFSPSPTVYLYPNEYKGITDNYDEKLTLNNFPMCSWANDGYAQWLAMNKGTLGLGLATNIGEIAVGAITRNVISVGVGLQGISSTLAQGINRSVQPQQAKGNLSGGGSAISCGLQTFHFMPTCITAEYAERIDKFFEMYGYKVATVKIPNKTGRPYWNYVKTLNCVATGSIPFNDMSKIKDIYNNGITFWHGDYVGNYSLNNH